MLSRDPNADGPRTIDSASGLSPDARYDVSDYPLSVKRDSDSIVAASTGDRTRLDAADRSTLLESQWIDEHTVVVEVVQGSWRDPEVSLWRCEVPRGTCAESATGIEYDSLQLPDGEHNEPVDVG